MKEFLDNRFISTKTADSPEDTRQMIDSLPLSEINSLVKLISLEFRPELGKFMDELDSVTISSEDLLYQLCHKHPEIKSRCLELLREKSFTC